MDSRLGCILGKIGQSFFGIARNQITVMKFTSESNDWFPVVDSELPSKDQFSYKDLTDAKSIGAVENPSSSHEEEHEGNKWQGMYDIDKSAFFQNIL